MNTDVQSSEFSRLCFELEQANQEKIQSARLGLLLLNENTELTRRCEELEASYDEARTELSILREALRKAHTHQRISVSTGIEQEVSLLQESAEREASLGFSLQNLERDLVHARQELRRVTAERDRMIAGTSKLRDSKETLGSANKGLRCELRDLKIKQEQLINENNELEKENIALQQQVSKLRQSQSKSDALEYEARRLAEEVESLNRQLVEITDEKDSYEKRMLAALELLQAEREEEFSLQGSLEQENEAAALRAELDREATVAPLRISTAGDLFDEFHQTIRSLEEQLTAAKLENESLSKALEECERQLEQSRSALGIANNTFNQLGKRVGSMMLQAEKVGLDHVTSLQRIGWKKMLRLDRLI
ncbi:protein bicaudal D-like [Galendromus occidentalis]|uniref:Protein bicaudal D-like n=1 Tax=Galendromus occidentalis TaxID=34638 RepID=A0AAJ6QWP7_9ACAR|nr:protein bicaudal D-like [Galendromus occidentalis]